MAVFGRRVLLGVGGSQGCLFSYFCSVQGDCIYEFQALLFNLVMAPRVFSRDGHKPKNQRIGLVCGLGILFCQSGGKRQTFGLAKWMPTSVPFPLPLAPPYLVLQPLPPPLLPSSSETASKLLFQKPGLLTPTAQRQQPAPRSEAGGARLMCRG